MRKSGILTLLVIVAMFFVISIILSDAFFESTIEDIGSDMVGAKVEIDGFDFSLFDPGIRWQRLQVTDPKKTMKNMIETGFCEFDLEFWPLFSGKFVIENLQLSDLKTNTDRETDGALPKKPKSKKSDSGISRAKDGLNSELEKLPAFNIASSAAKINADSIVSILKLQSPAKIDSAKTLIESTYTRWEEKINASDPEKDIKKIKNQVESIDVKKIKSVKDFTNALSSVKTLQASVDSLNNSYKQIKKDFDADYSGSGNALSQIDNWIKDDYAKAMSLAKLPDISAQNIGKMLFGGEIVNQVNEYLGYIATARGYMDKIPKTKKEPDPPRLKGQNIYFPSKNARPDFWLKQLSLSGYLSEVMPLSGKVTDVTSNPKMIGRPVEIDISGSNKNKQFYGLDGTLNYLDSIPKENFTVEYSGFSIAGMKLSKSELLPQSIKKGSGVLNTSLNLNGDFINAEISLSSDNIEFDFGSDTPSDKLQSIIRDVFQQTRELNLKAKIKGKTDDLVFSIKTNFDDALVNAFKATANKEIEQAKQKIREKIDKTIAQKKEEAEKLIAENKQKLEAKLEQIKEKIDQQKKDLDKHKEKIEKEKNNLGKQVKDKLKDLF